MTSAQRRKSVTYVLNHFRYLSLEPVPPRADRRGRVEGIEERVRSGYRLPIGGCVPAYRA
jgi:hypothetical protein